MTYVSPARRTRYCRDCDGFPVVHIDTGVINRDGSRCTLPVVCRTCHGTGRTPARRSLSSVGR